LGEKLPHVVGVTVAILRATPEGQSPYGIHLVNLGSRPKAGIPPAPVYDWFGTT